LDFPHFDEDRDDVLTRAIDAGVTGVINPGTDLESSRRAVALAEWYDNVYAAVGVHPHDASTVDDQTLIELRQLASHPKVVAIGEIGLDYYRDLSPRARQVSLGFLIGVGGPVTFKNARRLPEIVPRLPLNCLVIETDAPYLAPHPHRGKRNEPAYMALVAERLAQLRGSSLDELACHVTENTLRLFRLPSTI
jgi:TatD DNase family protein